MTNLIFLTTTIDCGGAEKLLLDLVKQLANDYKITVIYIIGEGTYKTELILSGAEVFKLNLNSLIRTIKILCKNPKTILQGWMYHGNIVATILHLISLGKGKLSWALHHSANNYANESLKHFLLLKLTAFLSSLPKAIIFVSEIIKQEHIQHGYSNDNMRVIHNGIDTSLFKRNEETAYLLRQSLNIPNDTVTIGIVGRNHPVKDYRTFFRASYVLLKKHQNLHIIIVGRDISFSQFSNQLKDLNFEDINRIHLLGERNDVPQILSIIDVFVLTSVSESFALSLIEALAAGCCCVSTDVIFFSNLFSKALSTFPPYNYQALVDSVEHYLNMSKEQRDNIAIEAKLQIEKYYPLSQTINNYKRLWNSI